MRLRGERGAFDKWHRRESKEAEHDGIKAMRSEGIGADAIKQMADLARVAGMSVQDYVAHLASKGG